MLTITEAARNKIRAVMEAQGRQGSGLRVSITGRTSAGFRYYLGLVEPGQEAADDVIIDSEGLKVHIDPQSAPNLQGATIDYIESVQGSGFKIDNPNPVWTDPKAMKVQELLDTRINPSVAAHGGYVELLDVKDDVVYVRLGGGCQGCGMVNVTLRQGIEALIRQEMPEIREVVDTTDHAAGTNPYYQPAKG
ncbi:MAG: Fe/S biogenesis protein NfuA [Candidatus Tectimicrobiota bacterium]|nr:MAG: Fe/S biogenesis protein NfuA [Candidatus Tectomicrobia bacterium]